MKAFKYTGYATAALLGLAAALPPGAAAQQGRWLGYGPGSHMMWGFGSGPFGGWLMIVFWVVLLVLAGLAVRWLYNAGKLNRATQPSGNALEVLKERYAKGEINKSQFEAMKRDIG